MREADLPEVPAVVDGAELLDELWSALARYVVLPSQEALDAVVLWIAATHGQPAWTHATRLVVKSPLKRCGKSRLLDIIEATCCRALMTMNATVPAIFRSIDADDPPVLLMDEADAIWSKQKSNGDGAEDLRALVNAGFGRGRPVLRCVGPQQEVKPFATFAMVALAAIGDCLPETVLDRSVIVSMRRRSPGEQVDSFRTRRDAQPLHELRDRLGAWVRAHLDELQDAEPVMPVEDRAADTWESLTALADLAGGTWPARARRACLVLTAEQQDADVEASTGLRLLADVRDVFDVPAVSSEELVRRLRSVAESPWETFGLDVSGLAYRLRPYGIRPDRIRVDGRQLRGYRLEYFADSFTRYLPPADPPSPPVTASQSQVRPVTPPGTVTPYPVTPAYPVTGLTCTDDGVTACDAPPAGGVPDPDSCTECGNKLLVAGQSICEYCKVHGTGTTAPPPAAGTLPMIDGAA